MTAHKNICAKTFWAVVLYLGLWLVPAVAAKLIFHAKADQLLEPYLAFTAPGAIFVPLATWLRIWEDRGAPPGRVALAWSLAMGLFAFATAVALFYAASVLHFVDPWDNLDAVVFTVLVLTLVASIGMYFRVREVVSRRATSRPSA